jgi:hypothetical protein
MGKVFKKAEDVVSDVFRPVNKVISRIVPNEIKPFIGPLASVLVPGSLVPGGAGIMSNFARGYFANLLADSAVNEGKTDLRKAALSGIFKTLPTSADIRQDVPAPDKTFMQKLATEGKEVTAKVGDFLNPSISSEEGKILSSIANVGKAVGTQAAAGAGFDIYDAAKAAQDAYQNSEDGYNTAEYLGYLRNYLANAGYSQQQIDDYVANRPSYNKGGRVGFAEGTGIFDTMQDPGDPYNDKYILQEKDDELSIEEILQILKDGVAMADPKPTESGNPADTLIDLPGELEDVDDRSFAGGPKSLLDPSEMIADNAGGGLGKMQQQLIQMGVNTSQMSPTEIMEIYNRMMGGESGQYFGAKKGGLATLKMGGMPSMEMDYRGGGFIPVGSKEKADDVPARLSKNEFVMTADAVRAAGGGSVNKGAQRMYQLMNALESKV